MNARAIAPVLILWFLILPSDPSHAQATNPPYLAGFPTIERVKTVIKGTDAVDSAARQVGAFWQLRQIVQQMSGFRQYRNQLTPDEGRLIGQYALGYQQTEAAIPPGLDKFGWNRAYSKYHYDDDLREEIFEKLLSPQIRALWAQTEEGVKRSTRASQQKRERELAAEDGFFKRVPASANTPKVARTIGAADPSIAKAKAAKVDTSIVGLQFGEPLKLPECALLGNLIVDPSTNRATVREACIQGDMDIGKSLGIDVDSISKELFGVEVDKSAAQDITAIRLTKEYCPVWVSQCTGYATLHNGRLAGIAFLTPGRGYEKTVTTDLRDKYGPPTRVVRDTVTPQEGNKFDINEPEWVLPGLYAEYEVVSRDPAIEGRRKLNEGVVRIMTESERTRRLANQKEKPKPKL